MDCEPLSICFQSPLNLGSIAAWAASKVIERIVKIDSSLRIAVSFESDFETPVY